jgi:hypothetical protein
MLCPETISPLEPELIPKAHTVLARRGSLSNINRSHWQANFPAAVVDTSAETNCINQDFARPNVVVRHLILGFDLSSGRHQVRAAPVLNRLDQLVRLMLSESSPVITEPGKDGTQEGRLSVQLLKEQVQGE